MPIPWLLGTFASPYPAPPPFRVTKRDWCCEGCLAALIYSTGLHRISGERRRPVSRVRSRRLPETRPYPFVQVKLSLCFTSWVAIPYPLAPLSSTSSRGSRSTAFRMAVGACPKASWRFSGRWALRTWSCRPGRPTGRTVIPRGPAAAVRKDPRPPVAGRPVVPLPAAGLLLGPAPALRRRQHPGLEGPRQVREAVRFKD